jgi:Family of unknown function (DUF5329)
VRALLLTGLLTTLPALAVDPNVEVEFLIQAVADSGCTYTRNGTDHEAAEAADHLRLKYNRGKRYADTAEQFIDRLASESSWSGIPYSMTCDGVTSPSGDWLYKALRQYRNSQP